MIQKSNLLKIIRNEMQQKETDRLIAEVKQKGFSNYHEMIKCHQMGNSVIQALYFHFEEVDKEKLFHVIDTDIGYGQTHIEVQHDNTEYVISIKRSEKCHTQ